MFELFRRDDMMRLVFAALCALFMTMPVMAGQPGNSMNNANNGALRDGMLFGQLSTAEAVPLGAIDVGGSVGFFDDANAVFGHFRMGIASNTEFELRSGIDDTERGDDPHFMISLSAKTHFLNREDYTVPDMALSLFGEYYDVGHDANVWILGFGLIGSHPIELSSNVTLTPYSRLNFRAERLNTSGYKDSDFDIGLNMGVQFAPTNRTQFYGEFQIDDQWGFITGVNFAIY